MNGAVVIEASTARARADIARNWWWVAAGTAAAMALFTALALTLSRWVLRPLAALSDAVAHLAGQLPKPRATAPDTTIARSHGGPPEIRAVAESFDAMALAVVDSADAQRQLVADTAHAMRNPLAALSIRLDSLEPEVGTGGRTTFAGTTAEVERLTALLDGLLTLAVAESVPEFDPALSSPVQDSRTVRRRPRTNRATPSGSSPTDPMRGTPHSSTRISPCRSNPARYTRRRPRAPTFSRRSSTSC